MHTEELERVKQDLDDAKEAKRGAELRGQEAETKLKVLKEHFQEREVDMQRSVHMP